MKQFFRFLRFFKSDGDNVQHIRLGRTLESTIFEAVALFMVIITWILAVYMYLHAPETIPTHFDIHGNANNDGSRLVLLILAGFSTFITVLMMVCAYKPTSVVNMPIRLKEHRQYVLASRMVRVIALLSCLLFMDCLLMMCYPESPFPRYILIALVGIIVVVSFVFAILIKRARTS